MNMMVMMMMSIDCLGPLQVSDHIASVDDAFAIASLLARNLLDAHSMRWTLYATD